MSDFETLINNLEYFDLKIRIESIEALGQLGDKRAIGPLSKLINDPTEQIRNCAIWSLGLLKAAEVLIENLNNESEDVRKNIIEIIGNNEISEALESLIGLLQDPNEEIRASSAWALGKLENRQAFKPLIQCLNDEYDEVRENASWALGKLKDVRAIPYLLNALSDPNEIVKMNAKESIDKIYKHLQDLQISKKRLGIIYECSEINDFCKKEKKTIEKYSDKYVTVEIHLNNNCKFSKICVVKLL